MEIYEIRHEKSKRKERIIKYICNICKKDFIGQGDLRRHLRIHSDERPFVCNVCGRAFRQSGCLKNHIASQHGTSDLFICAYCRKSFPIKDRLRLHMRIHSGVKPYKCELCSKLFARGGQLKQHRVTHFHNLQSHRNNNCLSNKNIKSTNNSKKKTCSKCKKHRNAAQQQYDCRVCNSFGKPDEDGSNNDDEETKLLDYKLKCISDERQYRCQVCWRTFFNSSSLKLHIRKHTGEKPFKCPLCTDLQTSFTQLAHLKTHMKAIHKMNKSYMCEYCKKFYKTKIEIDQHLLICNLRTIPLPDHFPSNGSTTSSTSLSTSSTASSSTDNRKYKMTLSRMRLLIVILLKKLLPPERLRILRFEKRLIDNVLIDACKIVGQKCCEDSTASDYDRLLININLFLTWTIPPDYMKRFEMEKMSTEQLLEELTMNLKVVSD